MIRFFRKAFHWAFYRLSIRRPRLLAWLLRELPTRPIDDLYTEAAPWRRRIPNVVYQTWVEPALGRTHRGALARFRQRNADFSFRFFSDAEAAAFMAEAFGHHPIHKVFENGLFGPLRMDIWRYCMLYAHGGVYCDIGKALTKPLRDLIPAQAAAVIAWESRNVSPFPVTPRAAATLQHPDKRVINWALMFAPRHPLLKRVIDGIVDRYAGLQGTPVPVPKDAILAFTGPLWLTECVLAAAEAGELDDVSQAGIEFHGSAAWDLPGSYVRYIGRPAYVLARNRPIVS